jgi:signal transduction histidine kinase
MIARPLAHASRASFLLFDRPWLDNAPAQHYENIAAWTPGKEQTAPEDGQHSIETMQLGKLLRRDGPVVIPDILADPAISPLAMDVLTRFNTRSMILFPLIASGNWFGVLAIHSQQPAELTETDARHLHGLVDQASVALYSILVLKAEAQARRRAEEADELKLKFLAMISHELRTPLTSIKGFATTLLETDVTWDANSTQEFIGIISDESDKLTDLIEQLLDLSRLEAGTLRIQPADVSLAQIVFDSLGQLQMLAGDHPMELTIPPDLHRVRADPRRVAQVLSNLVSNAAKYSPEGKSIYLSAVNEGRMVCISVSDDGQGIPEEERDLVFEAFRQATNRSQRDTKGAGLGLAISRALIDAHGGRIWVEERATPGTTISFTLPIAAEIPVSLPATESN